MTELKFYREGTPFTGSIRRTAATSQPAWPLPPRAREGAPNVLVFLLDDVGFAQLGCYGSDIRTPAIDRLAGQRIALPRLPHDRHLLADARVPAHRPQSSQQRGRASSRRWPRDSPATTAWCHARTAFFPRCCSRRATRHSPSASGISRSPANTRPARRRRAGRCRAASSASTDSSAARRTSGCPRSCTTATTSIPRDGPRRAITSMPISPIARSST